MKINLEALLPSINMGNFEISDNSSHQMPKVGRNTEKWITFHRKHVDWMTHNYVILCQLFNTEPDQKFRNSNIIIQYAKYFFSYATAASKKCNVNFETVI